LAVSYGNFLLGKNCESNRGQVHHDSQGGYAWPEALHTNNVNVYARWLHLLGNMLYLYIFGDNVEDVFGHGGYMVFYVTCGLAAAFTHILSLNLGLTYPIDFNVGVVGASGATSGVLGAYFVLFPKARILTVVAYLILPIPAILFLGFWFLLQWLYGLFEVGSTIAYWAHVGGFLTGMVLATSLGLKRKRKETKTSPIS